MLPDQAELGGLVEKPGFQPSDQEMLAVPGEP
jgi:hypothetical protein